MTHGRAIVVYADDDELVRDTIAASLAADGWQVYTCADGAEAIALCEKWQPYAVLLDLNMPHLDGFEAAMRLRSGEDCHPVRIIAITGRATDQNMKKAWSCGFDAVLAKPFRFEALADALVGPPER